MQDKEKCSMCQSYTQSFRSFPVAETTDAIKLEMQQESSAKIKALLELLLKARENDPSVQSVVFSQFSGMLNLPLEAAGLKFVRIDGSMTLKKREAALRAFQSKDPSSPSVFLLRLKAAGVGLNLVAASRVFMLDPWWNPAVEEQAMDGWANKRC